MPLPPLPFVALLYAAPDEAGPDVLIVEGRPAVRALVVLGRIVAIRPTEGEV